MYVQVKSLHIALQKALESVNYHRADISVKPATEVSPISSGGSGRRAFIVLVNMDNEQFQTHWGSWGGANPWNRSNAVDLDTSEYPLPHNGAAIKGERGYQGTFASIYVNPALMPLFLGETVELTQVEKDCLYCYRSIKGGNYRREELRQKKVTQDVTDAMVERGFLKRDARGFTSITTEGKNAIEGYKSYGF